MKPYLETASADRTGQCEAMLEDKPAKPYAGRDRAWQSDASKGKPRFLAITKAKRKLWTAFLESSPTYILTQDSGLQVEKNTLS